ncbi:MAG: lysozyme inhibitor LprI family protein [Burkholderiaceae bacterium]|nr:lysozyme inhibitor LprI family protein [Burkholderiaceae bacterium]
MSPARSQESIEVGGSCDSKHRPLASPFLCFEGSVVDCLTPANSREQLYCADSELRKADNELNRLYKRARKRLEMLADEHVDFKNARRALSESQRAWVKFKKSDCEVPGYLNARGSIQSAEIVDCEVRHTKNRISDLKTYLAR